MGAGRDFTVHIGFDFTGMTPEALAIEKKPEFKAEVVNVITKEAPDWKKWSVPGNLKPPFANDPDAASVDQIVGYLNDLLKDGGLWLKSEYRDLKCETGDTWRKDRSFDVWTGAKPTGTRWKLTDAVVAYEQKHGAIKEPTRTQLIDGMVTFVLFSWQIDV